MFSFFNTNKLAEEIQIKDIEDKLKVIRVDPVNMVKDFETTKREMDTLQTSVHALQDLPKKILLQERLNKCQTSASAITRTLLTTSSQPRTKDDDSIRILKVTRSQITDSEAIGIHTLNSLLGQNQQIKKQSAKLAEANSELGHSNQVLNKMGRWWRG